VLHDLDAFYPVKPYDPELAPERVPWLIDGFWQLGKINGMAGAEKSGKSRLLAWLMVGMVKQSVLGMKARGLPRTLYLAGEETRATVNTRLTTYAKLQQVDTALIQVDFIEAAAMRLDLATQRTWMEKKLTGYSMLVIDPLRRVHAADEDKSTTMAPILNDLRSWSNRRGLTVVFLHHTSKVDEFTNMDRMANWFRGSSDVAAIVDTAQYVDRVSKDSVMVSRAGRFAPLPPLRLKDIGGNVLENDQGFIRA